MPLRNERQQPTLALTYNSTPTDGRVSNGVSAGYPNSSGNSAAGKETNRDVASGAAPALPRQASSPERSTAQQGGGARGRGVCMDDDVAANAVVATHALRGCAGLAAVPTGAAQLLAWPGLLLELLQIPCMPQVRGIMSVALYACFMCNGVGVWLFVMPVLCVPLHAFPRFKCVLSVVIKLVGYQDKKYCRINLAAL